MFISAAPGRAAWKEGWNVMGCQLGRYGIVATCYSNSGQQLGLGLLSP
jgi:hypothetical protein